ncbi:MAG: hypothetical protein RSC12_07150 [Alistipes sp.]
MKTILSTLALFLACSIVAPAAAQTGNAVPVADTVMLSQTVDGDYLVHRYIVNRSDDADYALRYQMNLAKLQNTLNGNAAELAELDAFMSNLMRDTLMKVQAVCITGYASPDGVVKQNQLLAQKRAADFKQFLDQKYVFSTHYNVVTDAIVEGWEACVPMVAASTLQNRQALLSICDSRSAPQVKEQKLREMPTAWNYLKNNVLPDLRRVELVINYRKGVLGERRTMIAQPAPQPKPCCPCPCVIIDESVNSFILELEENKD